MKRTAIIAGCLLLFSGIAHGDMLDGPPRAPIRGSVSIQYTAPQTGQIYASGYVNKLRDGTLDVWQRGTSALATATAARGAYTADGWRVQQTGAAFTCAQDTGNNGPLYSLKCVGGTSNTDTLFIQPIESYVAAPLAGQTVTVQFQYKQTSGSAIAPKVSTCYASSQDVFSTCTGDLSATSITSCATATWCTESYTFAVSASATNGYQVTFDCNTALTAAQACWITAADIRVTPGVATGVNANPPPPELRPIQTELALCQRYFAKSYDTNTAPATSTVNGTVGAATLGSSGVTNVFPYVQFPVVMRASPTVALYANDGTPGNFSNGANLNHFVGIVTDTVGLASMIVENYTTPSGSVWFQYTASAEL